MMERIIMLMIIIGSLCSGFFFGLVVMGRHIQKELLGHGNWNYSARRLIDEVKAKMQKP